MVEPLSPEVVLRLNQLGGGMPRGDEPFRAGDQAFPLGDILQGLIESALDFKESCRVATTAPIVLSGIQVIDGVALAVGDRVLVKNQGGGPSDPTNGWYNVQTGAWTRTDDADTSSEVTAGAITPIDEGATNAGFLFILTTPNPIILNVTALSFAPISGAIGLAILPPADVDKSAAVVGVSGRAAREDHKHDIVTAAPGIGIGSGNTEGVAASLARSDHNHTLRETGGPTDLTMGAVANGEGFLRSGATIIGFTPIALTAAAPVDVTKAAAAVGVATDAARADHKHDITTAAPAIGIGSGNTEGVATTLARSDHNHALRETGGPTDLTIGPIAAGEALVRSGATIVGTALAPTDLQTAYNGSAGSPATITLDTTRDGIRIAAIAGVAGDYFAVQDQFGNDMLAVDGTNVEVGLHRAVLSTAAAPISRFQDTTNSIQFWPTNRTFTTAQGAVMALQNTYILNYPSVSFGALNLQSTIQHNQAGFAFNHGLLFNHGNNYYNLLNTAVNFGPLQGFIDQPQVRVNRTSPGTISMGLFRSFLSQPLFGRQSTNGTLSVTAVANFQALGQVLTGATIGTFRRIQAGPFFLATGTITQMYGLDCADETGPTSITAIRIQQNAGGGTRRAIDVTGTAISTFAADLHMNNGVSLVLGTVAANRVELLRSAAGVMRMIGQGGTFNEALEWDFDPATANTIDVQSSTGAGLGFNLPAMAVGTTAADPTSNWQFLFGFGAKTISIGGDFARVLFSASANVTIDAAVSTAATYTINSPALTIGTGSVVTAANVNIQTNPGVGTNRVGLVISSNPAGGGGINAALWVTAGLSRFDGRVDINNGIALGGGAAATLGTIGATGPTAAAQAQWLEIDIGGTPHWIPVWT